MPQILPIQSLTDQWVAISGSQSQSLGEIFRNKISRSRSSEDWFSRSGMEHQSSLARSCPTLCHPLDFGPPGCSVHGIFQARILEQVAISFSRGSSQPRDSTLISYRLLRWHAASLPLCYLGMEHGSLYFFQKLCQQLYEASRFGKSLP